NVERNCGDIRTRLVERLSIVSIARHATLFGRREYRRMSMPKVSCYAGMVPRRYQSGQMDRQGRIHKRGPRLLRSALVEAAWIMLRLNPWARALYERLCAGQKTRRKKAIVAVARKLLVRCWVMLLRKEPWKEVTQPVGAFA